MFTSDETFIFSTNVTEATTENEFIVEIFRQLTDTTQESMPIKVTNTFDEIIDFFEQMKK